MMRAWSWEAPRWCPSSSCSSPSTRAPALASTQAAALPSAPSPTTTTSNKGPAGKGRGPWPACRAQQDRSGVLAQLPEDVAADVEAGLLHGGEPAAGVGARGHAPLDALAHGPVLAVDQVPEVGRVRRVEARPGLLVGVEQQLAHDRGLGRAVGPEGEGGDVVGGQAEHQVGVDEIALVPGALVVVQAGE